MVKVKRNFLTKLVCHLSVIRHHDEHQRQEEGDQVHVQQAIPQAW